MNSLVHSLFADERGVSTQIGYVISAVITVVIAAGLLTASGTMVENTTKDASEKELKIIGERVAAGLMEADQLAEQSPDADFKMVLDLPSKAPTTSYLIAVHSGPQPSDDYLVLSNSHTGAKVRIPMTIETKMKSYRISGGRVAIKYTGNKLILTEV